MTRRIATLALLAVFVPRVGTTAEDIVIWKEFVRTLREGKLTEDRIRPYYEQFKQPLLGLLTSIPAKAKPEDWEKLPEIHRVDDQLHFLIPLTANGKKVTYCFTLLAEGDKWYFQHLESISIRLDKLEPLPAERFPDLREGQKNWIRQEWHVSQQIRLFNFLAKEKGKPFAFNWFKDGAGYFLAARTWLPFVRPAEAFILYLCWEQANLNGDHVVLESLDLVKAKEAVVRMEPTYFKLYARTGHLRLQISSEEYRKLFETVWQDRAAAAGWNLQVEYNGQECTFRFRH